MPAAAYSSGASKWHWRQHLQLPLLLLCAIVFSFPQLASSQSSGTVTLAWDANTEPDLAGYFVHYGVTSGVYLNKVNVGLVTTNTISGLVQGVSYYFAVTAYNTSGLESEPSNEIPYTVPFANAPPVISS